MSCGLTTISELGKTLCQTTEPKYFSQEWAGSGMGITGPSSSSTGSLQSGVGFWALEVKAGRGLGTTLLTKQAEG